MDTDEEAEADLEADADSEKPDRSPSAEQAERDERERAEPSGGPHDETESGGDPDGSGVVEHMLASGAEVDPGSDHRVAPDDELPPETETTPEGLAEAKTAAADEG